MKKRILFGIIGLFLLSFILIANESKTEIVKPQGNIGVALLGPGELSTNASVRFRSEQTGIDYYGYYDGPQWYLVDVPLDESFEVFVCTGYPSHGYTTLKPGHSGYVHLSGGECPYGD